MKKRGISLLHLAAWIFFFMAVRSFLGLGSTAKGLKADFLLEGLSGILPIPDFKTILLAGIAAFLGYLVRSSSRAAGESAKRGSKVIVCSILCIVLTFTPISRISLFTGALSLAREQVSSDGYEPVPEELYTLYAFLGSRKSYPADVDILRYTLDGYDGHAEDSYFTYKICGWMANDSGAPMNDVTIKFVLVDAEGNDILIKGKPAVLTTNSKSRVTQLKSVGPMSPFETDTVEAEDLSAEPYGYRVESVEMAYFINVYDGTKVNYIP